MSRPYGPHILPSDITPEAVFMDRRRVLAQGLAAGALLGAATPLTALAADAAATDRYKAPRNARYSVTDTPNSYEEITGYNNFYEFGTDKSDPAANARNFKPTPWTKIC